ncbi:MAG: hypothetical protein ABFS32_02525 [Bacteroidota bacterium]
MKNHFIIVIILSLSSNVYGQFTMEAYLGNSISDTELNYLNSIKGYLKENNFKSPILREVEFRARVQNFGNGFEDYRLRFSPLNPLERRANKVYKEALSDQFNIEYQLKVEEILLNRYSIIIEHHLLSSRKKTLVASAEVYQSIMDIYQDQPDNASLKDFIATDKALLEVILNLESINNKLKTIEHTIKLTYPYSGVINWETQQVVSVEGIKEWFHSNLIENPNNNLYLKNEKQKGIVADTELKVEKQSDFRNLGFIQAEYREDVNNSFFNNLGMQLAFSLPIVNPDKPDLERDRLELLENSKKLEHEQVELETYLEESYINLDHLLKQYEIVSNKLSDYENQSVYSFNRDALDTYKEIHDFKTDLSLLKQNLVADILNSYISLLSFNGQLSAPPYINYLSPFNNGFEMTTGDQ